MKRKAGFHSGEVLAKSANINNRRIHNKLVFSPKDFNLGLAMLSGVHGLGFNPNVSSGTPSGAAAAVAYTGTDVVAPGLSTFGWTDLQSGVASTSFTVPENMPRDTQANVNVFWAASGVASAGSVVLAVDYRTTVVVSSGISAVATYNYQLSGAQSSATTTYKFVSGAATAASGITALQKTQIVIPTASVIPNSFVYLGIRRATGNDADTFVGVVQVVAVEVEFVDV